MQTGYFQRAGVCSHGKLTSYMKYFIDNKFINMNKWISAATGIQKFEIRPHSTQLSYYNSAGVINISFFGEFWTISKFSTLCFSSQRPISLLCRTNNKCWPVAASRSKALLLHNESCITLWNHHDSTVTGHVIPTKTVLVDLYTCMMWIILLQLKFLWRIMRNINI